jgi:hypothetical protein
MENGVWLAAANRTGGEPDFDCRGCKSYVFSPDGDKAGELISDGSALLEASVPLDNGGDFSGKERREAILESRRPWLWHRIYANLSFFRDLTAGFSLPEPGETRLHLLASGKADPVAFLEEGRDRLGAGDVCVLPLGETDPAGITKLEELAKKLSVTVITASEDEDGEREHLVVNSEGAETLDLPDDRPYPLLHAGTLAIELTSIKNLIHPEAGIAAAKRGADLLLAVEGEVTPDGLFAVSMRTIDQAACCVAARNAAGAALIPEGHAPGEMTTAEEGSWLTWTLDSRLTRKKRFQDRMDFGELFRDSGRGPWED